MQVGLSGNSEFIRLMAIKLLQHRVEVCSFPIIQKPLKKARFLATQARDPAPHYQHSEIGYNYRLSNILAGIGRSQLEVLDNESTKEGLFFKLINKS